MTDNLIITEKHLRLEAPPEIVKLIAVAVYQYSECLGELPKTVSDFLYNMEAAYQKNYDLNENDWNFTREDAIEIGLMEVSDG